jgi:hypothetical protein
MSQLLEFYRGDGLDSEGRSLERILAFSDDQMEVYHDFIQWIFPMREASQFNPRAPVLQVEDIEAFHEEDMLRENLRRSYSRFLEFLGLCVDEHNSVVPAADYARKQWRLTEPNHNWLRITRVLHSLRLLGLDDVARDFHAGLMKLVDEGRARVSPDTLAYWRDAAFPRGQ